MIVIRMSLWFLSRAVQIQGSMSLCGFYLCVCVWFRQVPWNPEVDQCWLSLLSGVSEECEPEWCDSEDPLFILYTSGSTGKPKVHMLCSSGTLFLTPFLSSLGLI
jgi:acyl-coenzyme A synthetase/AMP-(fatty) acid ligase